jgi:hypothetical protein
MRVQGMMVAAVLVVVSVVSANANLLLDSGFDGMTLQALAWDGSPWWGGGGGGTDSGGGGWISDAQAQSAGHSAVLFQYGSDWTYAMVAQSVSGVEPGQLYDVRASFFRNSSIDPAQAFLAVEWRDAGGATFATNIVGGMFDSTYSADSWHRIGDTVMSPLNAASLSFQIRFVKEAGADPGDIWIDDASLTEAIPEPATLSLLGGLLALVMAWRKAR